MAAGTTLAGLPRGATGAHARTRNRPHSGSPGESGGARRLPEGLPGALSADPFAGGNRESREALRTEPAHRRGRKTGAYRGRLARHHRRPRHAVSVCVAGRRILQLRPGYSQSRSLLECPRPDPGYLCFRRSAAHAGTESIGDRPAAGSDAQSRHRQDRCEDAAEEPAAAGIEEGGRAAQRRIRLGSLRHRDAGGDQRRRPPRPALQSGDRVLLRRLQYRCGADRHQGQSRHRCFLCGAPRRANFRRKPRRP